MKKVVRKQEDEERESMGLESVKMRAPGARVNAEGDPQQP